MTLKTQAQNTGTRAAGHCWVRWQSGDKWWQMCHKLMSTISQHYQWRGATWYGSLLILYMCNSVQITSWSRWQELFYSNYQTCPRTRVLQGPIKLRSVGFSSVCIVLTSSEWEQMSTFTLTIHVAAHIQLFSQLETLLLNSERRVRWEDLVSTTSCQHLAARHCKH